MPMEQAYNGTISSSDLKITRLSTMVGWGLSRWQQYILMPDGYGKQTSGIGTNNAIKWLPPDILAAIA